MSETEMHEKVCGECGEQFEAGDEDNATILKDIHYVEEHIDGGEDDE